MTTEKVVLAAVSEVFVKEEVDVDESKLFIPSWDISNNCKEEWTQKCGEVFRTNNGQFTFVCTQCNCDFMDVVLFGNHLQDQNCELKLGTIGHGIVDSDRISYKKHTDVDEVGDIEDECKFEMYGPVDKIENTERIAQTANQFYDVQDIKRDTTANETQSRDNDGSRKYQPNNDSGEERSTDTDGENLSEIDSVKSNTTTGKVKHTKVNIKKAEKRPFCAACSRGYASEFNFRSHLRKKHSDMLSLEILKNSSVEELEENLVKSLKEMVCIYCFKCFDSIDEFRKHAIVHVGTNMFFCKFCPKSFGSQYNRQVHMNTHEDIRPYKCSYCPKAFSSPPNLQNHERLHLNIRRFTCNYCDKQFVKGSDRTSHERIHTKELPYPCEECGRRFITSSRLKDHNLRHQGIRNFKCSECGKAFYTKVLLKDHMQAHSEEQRFECKTCGRKFRWLKGLTQHEAIHSDIKKYVCNVCEKAFAQFAGLYRHTKTHRRVAK